MLCSICLGLDKNATIEAVTVINGSAVCVEHIHHVAVTGNYTAAWDLARSFRDREENRKHYEEASKAHFFVSPSDPYSSYAGCLLCGADHEAPIHLAPRHDS